MTQLPEPSSEEKQQPQQCPSVLLTKTEGSKSFAECPTWPFESKEETSLGA